MPAVAVVEDDELLREVVLLALRAEGYVVEAYDSIASAAAALVDGPCDLLLTDVHLPDGDGIELAARLLRVRGLPFIVMSARGTDEDRERAREAGAIAFLRKPFGLETLAEQCAAAVVVDVVKEVAGLPDRINALRRDLQQRRQDLDRAVEQLQRLIVRVQVGRVPPWRDPDALAG